MQHLYIHPETPQPRLIDQAVSMLRSGGLIVYPSDTAYAFGCALGEKKATERVIALRRLDKKHQFTLLCRDLSEIASYAKVSNEHYRLLKAHTPAPITFILEATREVPKRLMHPKKKTIGIRVPKNPVSQCLLEALGEPMLTSTLKLPQQKTSDSTLPMDDPYEISLQLEHGIDLLMDAGISTRKVGTIVDLTGDEPILVRQGAGDVSNFLP